MIQKYEVDDFRQTHTVPYGSDFLSVMINRPKGNIALYFAVDPKEEEFVTRTFWIVSIGRTIPNDSNFMGSFEQEGMNFHIFELLNRNGKKIIN